MNFITAPQCVSARTHLTKCDDDGFCEYCGLQDSDEEIALAELSKLPDDLKSRIHWGWYNVPESSERSEKFYIDGVDGMFAIIGRTLPSVEKLRKIVANADVQSKKACREQELMFTAPQRIAKSKIVLAQNAAILSDHGFELWPLPQKFVNADRVWYKHVNSKFRCQDHPDKDLRVAVYEYNFVKQLDVIRYLMHVYACTVFGGNVTIDLHDIDLKDLDAAEKRIIMMWELANI